MKEQAHFETRTVPEGRMSPADARIHAEVRSVMASHPELDVSGVSIEVARGVVTMSGLMSDRDGRRQLVRELRGLYGVLDVVNNVRMRHRDPCYSIPPEELCEPFSDD